MPPAGMCRTGCPAGYKYNGGNQCIEPFLQLTTTVTLTDPTICPTNYQLVSTATCGLLPSVQQLCLPVLSNPLSLVTHATVCYCPTGFTLQGSVCKSCPVGYSALGNFCLMNCTSNYYDCYDGVCTTDAASCTALTTALNMPDGNSISPLFSPLFLAGFSKTNPRAFGVVAVAIAQNDVTSFQQVVNNASLPLCIDQPVTL